MFFKRKNINPEFEKKVEQLSDHVSTGKGIVKVLVVLGSLAAGVIGYFNFK